MLWKIPKPNNQAGMTLVELVAVMAIIGIFIAIVLLRLNPAQEKSEANDNKRLSDIALLDRIINEYLIDNGSYPDLSGVLRDSTSLPDAQTISLDNSTSGWIDQNLSKYTSRLPLDPINDSTYKYEYFHNDTSYELNAVLEMLSEYMVSDGGNNNGKYEMGNNLLLLN